MKIFNYLLTVICILLLTTTVFAQNGSDNLVSAVQDTAITGFIKTKIALDKMLTNQDVNVSTTNGKVTLSGQVNSDAEASELIQLAQSTTGVKEIDASQLKIKKSKQPFTDLMITAEVKGLFLREKLFGDKEVPVTSIHVQTNNGVVTLTGTASNAKQANTALALAKSVKGVNKVESTVTIVKNN